MKRAYEDCTLANNTPAPDYLAWLKKDVWTLTEFSRLWAGLRPMRFEHNYERIRTGFRMHTPTDQKIFTAAFEAVLAGRLTARESQGTHFVQPSAAMAWGKGALDIAPPEALEKAFNREPEHTKKPTKKLKPCQRHKTQCREIAKRLWEENPALTIADLILGNKEFIDTGCEGKAYVRATMHNWIKDLCPNRSPGRRPDNKAQ